MIRTSETKVIWGSFACEPGLMLGLFLRLIKISDFCFAFFLFYKYDHLGENIFKNVVIVTTTI